MAGVTGLVLVLLIGVWAVSAFAAALIAWPALIPELVVAAVVAVDVTSPQPRLVRHHRKGH